MSAEEVRDTLIGAFPPGVQEQLAPDEDGGGQVTRHLGAIAASVQDKAIDLVELLARDITPLTCGSERLADWERALGLSWTRTALFGTLPARRAAVISRLREYGPPTKAMLQAVLGPLLDYPDPSVLTILECDRTVLRQKHTYAGIRRSATFTSVGPASWEFWVNDDDRVAPGCVQADVTLTIGDVSKVAVDVQTPDGAYFRVPYGSVGRGAATGTTYRLYFPKAVTPHVLGTWRLYVYLTGPGSGAFDDASLFCEGFGRNGLSAAQFEWAAVYEAAKSNGSPDFDAARAAATRVSLASRIGGLVFPAAPIVGLPAGDWAGIPNDNTTPSGYVPG